MPDPTSNLVSVLYVTTDALPSSCERSALWLASSCNRARIEQAVGKLKRFERTALRCEKTAANFLSLVLFACGLILVKPVHRA